jgi:hypothetical protein
MKSKKTEKAKIGKIIRKQTLRKQTQGLNESRKDQARENKVKAIKDNLV